MTVNKTPSRKEKIQRERRRRKSFGGLNQKLAVSEEFKEENYEYRWINDNGNRIFEKTKQDDWDHVTSKEVGVDENDTGSGTVIERHVGTRSDGTPLKAFLCKKLKEDCKQDRLEARQKIDETEEAILQGPVDGGLSKKHSYVPEAGSSIKTSGDYKP